MAGKAALGLRLGEFIQITTRQPEVPELLFKARLYLSERTVQSPPANATIAKTFTIHLLDILYGIINLENAQLLELKSTLLKSTYG